MLTTARQVGSSRECLGLECDSAEYPEFLERRADVPCRLCACGDGGHVTGAQIQGRTVLDLDTCGALQDEQELALRKGPHDRITIGDDARHARRDVSTGIQHVLFGAGD